MKRIPTQKLSTLLHEAAHDFLNHTAQEITSAQKEFEADALSILFTSAFGLEVTDARREHLADSYRLYRAEWAEDEKAADKLKNVFQMYEKHIGPMKGVIDQVLTPPQQAAELPGTDQPDAIPGSGKSFFAKRTALERIFAADENQEIIFIDPEREYFRMLEKLDNSTVIRLSAASDTHINAMEIGRGYTDGDDPLVIKSEFLTSLCEQLVLPAALGAKEKSLIDRCTGYCLEEYIRGGCTGEAPTLLDFYERMKAQPETEAQGLALALEMFAKGNMNAFAQPSNVNVNSRIICYDTLDLGDSMKTIGLLVLFDNVMNRISRNRQRGIRTSIICDEFYLMLQQQFTADFFWKMWKRCRKYNADFTGITQNVDDLLHNPVARTILSNSEIIVMLNQAASDRDQLAELLDISDTQLEYITNAKEGYGLLRVGGEMIPFEDDFPKDTEIYKLLTTKPKEIKAAGV